MLLKKTKHNELSVCLYVNENTFSYRAGCVAGDIAYHFFHKK